MCVCVRETETETEILCVCVCEYVACVCEYVVCVLCMCVCCTERLMGHTVKPIRVSLGSSDRVGRIDITAPVDWA